jgi:hypothetical protein
LTPLVTGMKQRMKFNGPVAACVLGSLTLLCAATWSQTVKPQEYDDSEGYTVLSVLLDQYHWTWSTNVHIMGHVTTSGSMADSFESCKKIPDEFKSAARDFKEKNRQEWHLAKRFKLKLEYEFADELRKSPPPAPVPGEQELTLPPNPVNFVSAVGFDTSRTHAIAYVAAIGGPDGASGGYHLLVKERQNWKEVSQSPVCVWMSLNADDLLPRRAS